MLKTQPDSAKLLTKLLKQNPLPTELEITILSVDEETDSERQNLTATTYPSRSFCKVNVHLGIHAPDLPKLARDFRAEYSFLHDAFRQMYKRRKVGAHGFESLPETQSGDGFFLQQRLRDSTTCLLLLCPDHLTAYADRRLMIINSSTRFQNDTHGEITFLMEELEFLDLLFAQHSKAPNSWAHRKWVCRRILCNSMRTTDVKLKWKYVLSWAQHEIQLCKKVADRFPKNYYAWTHRSFVIRTIVEKWNDLESITGGSLPIVAPLWTVSEFLQEEVDSTVPWLTRHVSDHSAAHYGGEALRLWIVVRSKRLKQDEDRKQWKIKTIENVLEKSRNLVQSFSSHEVIWIWRRICCQMFLESMKVDTEQKMSCDEKNLIRDSMNLFVKVEIMETLERVHCATHSMTFLLWVLEQVWKCHCFYLIENPSELKTIYSEVSSSLEKNEKNPYTAWHGDSAKNTLLEHY